MSTATIIVLAITGLAVWTWIVSGLDEKPRRDLRVQSLALCTGIWFGFLSAQALGLVVELTGAEWLAWYEWPLGLAVCAIWYVRTTYRAGC